MLVAVLQILASLKVFDQIYVMTSGGPAGVTRSVVMYIFETGLHRLPVRVRVGHRRTLFFALIVIVSVGQVR